MSKYSSRRANWRTPCTGSTGLAGVRSFLEAYLVYEKFFRSLRSGDGERSMLTADGKLECEKITTQSFRLDELEKLLQCLVAAVKSELPTILNFFLSDHDRLQFCDHRCAAFL
jgi:hypothetical protein